MICVLHECIFHQSPWYTSTVLTAKVHLLIVESILLLDLVHQISGEHLTSTSVPMLWVGLYSYLQVWSCDIGLSQSPHVIFLATVADSGISVNEPILIISTSSLLRKKDSRGPCWPRAFATIIATMWSLRRSWGVQESRSWWGCLQPILIMIESGLFSEFSNYMTNVFKLD